MCAIFMSATGFFVTVIIPNQIFAQPLNVILGIHHPVHTFNSESQPSNKGNPGSRPLNKGNLGSRPLNKGNPGSKKPTTDPLVGCHDWYQIWQEMYADYDSKNIQQKLGNNVLTILIDTENKKPFITLSWLLVIHWTGRMPVVQVLPKKKVAKWIIRLKLSFTESG